MRYLRRSLAIRRGCLLCSVGSGDLFGPSGALLLDAEVASSLAYAFVRGRFSDCFVSVLLLSVPSGADVDLDVWPASVLAFLGRAARNRLWRPVWDVWSSVALSW